MGDTVCHVERMEEDNWVKRSREIAVVGQRGRGRPRKTWAEVVRDLAAKGVDRTLAQNRGECAVSFPRLTHASMDN